MCTGAIRHREPERLEEIRIVEALVSHQVNGRTAPLAHEIGWHLDFLIPGWLVSELMPMLRELPVEFTVAHFGLFPAKDGVRQPGFQEFLKNLKI